MPYPNMNSELHLTMQYIFNGECHLINSGFITGKPVAITD